jgi:hypothetical protein
MSQAALLSRVVRSLESLAIPYMVVGSLASSYHGEPRMTRDIDIVIDPSREAILQLVHEFRAMEMYVDPDAAQEALERRSSFNVVDPESGWKIDLLIRRDREFSRRELDRRLRGRLLDVDANIATAEDTILAKLEWARQGGSERQLRDVAAIVAVSGDSLEIPYIDRWAGELGVSSLWEEVRAGQS